MGTILQDIRFSCRMLAKNPGFAVIAILTLGVGIGATTAVFSVVDGVLLRPIPYEDPHRAVWIYRTSKPLAIHQKDTSIATYWDWKDRNTVFDSMALMDPFNVNISLDDGAERISAAVVTGEFFSVLGIKPLLGKVLTPGEFESNPDAAVISYGLWRRCFGGKADVLGDEIELDGRANTIVGVMPAGFSLPRQADVWKPLIVERVTDNRESNSYWAIGRLQPGVSLKQAQANMRDVSTAIGQDYPSPCDWSTDLITLQEDVVGSMRTPLLVLLGAVGLVLLIACANVANLLLARANTRCKEVAIRATLGARRWRLIRQFLCESLVLSLLGGGLGVMLAYWAADLLLAMSPGSLPRLDDVRVDARVLGFTLLLLPCVAVLFGLLPALRASKSELTETLKEGGRTCLTGTRGRILAALVVSEIALSLMLLVGAGLLMRSLRQLQETDPGIEVETILTMRVALSSVNYPEEHHVRGFFRELSDRVDSLPGVSSVAFTSALPISEGTTNRGTLIEADPLVPGVGSTGTAEYQWVSSNYHSVIGQRLEEGRLFTRRDHARSMPVAIINRTMARKLCGNVSPIGKRLFYRSREHFVRVVGIVSDVKRFGLDEAAPREVYLPISQNTAHLSRSIVVRCAGTPTLVANAVRNEIQELDRTAAVYRMQTMATIVSESMARTRFTTLLLSLFAGTAALLAGVGIYGVISHYIGQRIREIGLRVAFGATSRQILLLVLRQGSTLILMGVILGLGGAWALSRVMESLLFGVSATDPATFLAVAGLSATVAFVACYVPARRATKVDPMVALRCE